MTYKGTMGYAPSFAYLGQEGYGVHVQLREGSTHSQKDGADFLRQSIHYARRITNEVLLVRMEFRYDSQENLKVCQDETNVDYISSRSICEVPPGKSGCALPKAKAWPVSSAPEGQNIWASLPFNRKFDHHLRQVFQVIVRTIDRDGQLLLLPDIEVNVYWTSLTCSPWRVIELYRDHGTSEQFHSELKTDLDLERLLKHDWPDRIPIQPAR